jgi:plastocyanin
MPIRMPATAFAICLVLCKAAFASVLSIQVSDSAGRPASDAVVSVVPDDHHQLPSHLPAKAIIDQRNETFLPLVVVVRKGGTVVFTNNDVTTHHVYSFSPIKQFEFLMPKGQISSPVEFDQPGVAAIGCNIHDQMIAYVYVGDAPFAALTDLSGSATIRDLPTGHYHVDVWHPALAAGAAGPTGAVTMGEGNAELKLELPVAVQASRGMKPMHMDY